MSYARPINDQTPNISTGYSKAHPGIDYAYGEGTPTYASDSGTINVATDHESRQWIANSASDPYRPNTGTRKLTNADYGNYIIVDHGNGKKTLYAHLKKGSLVVKRGEQVKKGQKIGEVGSTGNSTGNHLHWEITENGVKISPADVLDKEFTQYVEGNPTNMPELKYTEEEMTKMRLERDENYNKYKREIELHTLTEQSKQKQIEELRTKLAQAPSTEQIEEAKKLLKEAHKQELAAMESEYSKKTAEEVAKVQVKLDEANTKISSLSKQVLDKGDEWKARLTSRKFLLTAPTAILNAFIALAVLFFGYSPDPVALGTALTSLNAVVALFVIPESITDNNVRVELAKN